jgi:hypothetical protein
MVHFPGLTRTDLCIQSAVTWFYQDRFPYSEIPGSKPACGSPRLIAACHVLHRLLAPRHPPYALSSLTIKLTQHVAIAGLWMITHAKGRPRAWSKFAFPHCATLEQIFAVYYAMRDLKLALHSASFLQLSKNFNPVNNFQLDCLPSRGSAPRSSVPKPKTLKRNKKPGNKRRANPSWLRVASTGGH